jgi:hypothetical protein
MCVVIVVRKMQWIKLVRSCAFILCARLSCVSAVRIRLIVEK